MKSPGKIPPTPRSMQHGNASLPKTLASTALQANDVTNECKDEDMKPSAATITPTMVAMVEHNTELGEDSQMVLIQHAITTDNMTLQQCLMALQETQGNNTSLSKLTKESIKLAETYEQASK
jgi:hypothetical protein